MPGNCTHLHIFKTESPKLIRKTGIFFRIFEKENPVTCYNMDSAEDTMVSELNQSQDENRCKDSN